MDFRVPEYFLRKSFRRAKQLLAELNHNDDQELIVSANVALANGH
jgi:hypothetical protein